MFTQKVEEEVELVKGSHVRVVTAESDKDKTDGKIVWVDYPNLPKVLKKGGKIYIDDGLIGLRVLEIGKVRIHMLIMNFLQMSNQNDFSPWHLKVIFNTHFWLFFNSETRR